MTWFRSRRPPPVAEEQAPAAPETHQSLALPDLLSQLHPDRRLHILDLGPAIGSNVAFWTGRHLCTVEVADLYPSLVAASRADPDAAMAAALPDNGSRPFDVVLAWDVFNYLDRPRLAALGARLAARSRPGTLLLALLWTGKEIPAEPGRFLIQDDSHLVYGVDLARTRPGPRYRPSEIAAVTRGFATDRSFLLRHGVQEYLLVRERDRPAEAREPG